MTQALIDLDPRPFAPADRIAFDLGWDHAQHGLAPPLRLLQASPSLGEGWHAARRVFGNRVVPATRPRRRWLALRLRAWEDGRAIARDALGPADLAAMQPTHCPVTRRPLGGCGDDEPTPLPLTTSGPWDPSRLVIVGRCAAHAAAAIGVDAMLSHARAIVAGRTEADHGLDAAAWSRLASLWAAATPLPHGDAARWPLRLQPPPRLAVANPAHRLQGLIAQQLPLAGWSVRLAALARRIEDPAARGDLLLLTGALAPRVIEALRHEDAARRAQALEDVWDDDRVRRRWHAWMQLLGEAGTRGLLAEAMRCGLCVVHATTAARPAQRSGTVRRPTSGTPASTAAFRRSAAPALPRAA
ncbi:MAG: hypothetical protein MUF03_15075 [Rubrivivax sp.]|jgi:hypothetical protein|nr:hypothetical protein [Rubrivivax sp.]